MSESEASDSKSAAEERDYEASEAGDDAADAEEPAAAEASDAEDAGDAASASEDSDGEPEPPAAKKRKRAIRKGGKMCDVCGKVTAEYGTRCAKHKGHTHKRTKGLCQHPDGCEKVGWYGSKRKGQITGRFCRSHAPRGAQLLNGGCEVQGCSKQASYGLASIRNKRFCASHKEDGMVHIGDLLKKERTQCRTDGCEEKAIYGASRMGPTHCSDHADDIIGTAIDFTQKCTEDGCKRRMAVWGDKSQPHDFTHCDAHKLPDQVPLKKWHQRNGPGVPVDTTKMIYV